MSVCTQVFLDIETIPTQRADVIDEMRRKAADDLAGKISELKAPSNYKDEAKIAEYIAAKRDELSAAFDEDFERSLHATGLDGAFGEVYCIGCAIDEREPAVFSRGTGYQDPESEGRVLRELFNYVNAERSHLVRIVGHNIIGFDIRFIHQRCMVLGVRPPQWLPLDPKPWGDEVFDTMIRWAGTRDRVKLSKLCRAFGIEDTDDIEGSQVWDCIKSGDFERVERHCSIDVQKVRSVFRRMTYAQDRPTSAE